MPPDPTPLYEYIEVEIRPEERLDQALMRQLATRGLVTRRSLKEALKKSPAFSQRTELKPSDQLNPSSAPKFFRLRVPKSIFQSSARENTTVSWNSAVTPTTLFQDDDFLILNKPPGLPSARLNTRSKSEPTAVDWAIREAPSLATAFSRDKEAGLLHRLDSDTSGALAFCKNPRLYRILRSEWNKRTEKLYRARIAVGETELHLPCIIDTPIGHSKKSSKRMIALLPGRRVAIRGKRLEAWTQILATPSADQLITTSKDVTVVIKTGVMHQIRVHCASIGHPIVGDTKYGGPPAKRLFLHAWKLGLLVSKDRRLDIVAPLPNDWQTPSLQSS